MIPPAQQSPAAWLGFLNGWWGSLAGGNPKFHFATLAESGRSKPISAKDAHGA